MFLDVRKAFYLLHHDILLKKLSSYNLSMASITFLRSYLQGRLQCLLVNGTYSQETSITSGVPQDWILGALLFCIFINNLPMCLTRPSVQCDLFSYDSYQSKKKYQETFTCPVTALAVSCRRRLTLCTCSSLHLSTWSPRFTSRDLYLRCRSLASRAKHSFYFGPPKINGSNSKLSALNAYCLFFVYFFFFHFSSLLTIYLFKNTEILLSMNNIEICLTTA